MGKNKDSKLELLHELGLSQLIRKPTEIIITMANYLFTTMYIEKWAKIEDSNF